MTRILALVCAVVALLVGGFLIMGPSGQNNLPTNPLIGAANAQDAADVDTSSIVEMAMGPEDAKVTLIEYASYTCPHCASFHAGPFKEIKKNYVDTGKIRFVYREVYFDRLGLWASMIARCAGPEKFFGINDLIYSGQAEWSRAGGAAEVADALRKIGRLAGIEADALDACLQDADKAQTLVAWFQQNAKADDIDSTPSFVLNGEKVANASYSELASRIDAALAD